VCAPSLKSSLSVSSNIIGDPGELTMKPQRIIVTVMRVVIAMTVLFSALTAHGQSRGIRPEDYFAFKSLNDVRFSPDGSTIAFVVGTIDQKQNRRHNSIWTVPADGSREASQLTTSAQPSTNRAGARTENSSHSSPQGQCRETRLERRKKIKFGCCRSVAVNRDELPSFKMESLPSRGRLRALDSYA
jgi:hypothetical protein